MEGTRLKALITAILIAAGGAFALLATPSSPTICAQGILLDFGNYDVQYFGVGDGDENAVSAVKQLAEHYSYAISWDGSSIASVTRDGTSYPESGSSATWSLYVTEKGGRDWTAYNGDPGSLSVGDYVAVCWGLCESEKTPTPGVDASGVCYYGYGQSYRIVSMAPSVTETVCAAGASKLIVAADEYSNYPSAIAESLGNGSIASIGGYTNPSYETVAQQNPDIVIGVENQSTHISIIQKMRSNGVNCLVAYDGDDIETIILNVYMIGVAISYQIKSVQVIGQIENALSALKTQMGYSVTESSVMITLSTAKSPWVSGGGTYASDIISFAHCGNTYGTLTGWVQVNSETVATYDPDCIIVVTTDIACSESAYGEMISSLSAEWKNTSAYESGSIYLLTDSAADLASRPSTRIAQFTELMCRILQPSTFSDIEVPKYIGDDYTSYLTVTKELGFES